MSRLRKLAAIYLVPAGVFQSVVVGGAYGTGREVVEFVSGHGPWGGLLAILAITLGFWAVLAASFEFARVFRVYDYRNFLRALLGRGWVAYEICFMLLLVIVLAVTGAAAGQVLADTFGIAPLSGTLAMLAAVVVCNFFGRHLVAMTLTAGAIALSGGLLAYGALVWHSAGGAILDSFAAHPLAADWMTDAAKFTMYNSALVPVLLYASADIERRGQAVGAAFIAACAGVLPALVLHLSFMADYPAVTKEALPAYWMMTRYASQGFLWVYVALLFMTIVQTGVGVLQGLNERLDAWRMETHPRGFSPAFHALLAGVVTGLSLLMSQMGLVALIAKGYGTLAWGFLVVFTLPLLTVGIWRIGAQRRSAG